MKFLSAFLALALFLPSFGFAATRPIERGGFGLLFPDHNSLRNIGETARSRGLGVQVSGSKFTGTHEQALAMSAAFATGKWALSAYGCRYGMDVADTAQSQDIFGAGLGVVFSDISFGVSVEREHNIMQTIARFPTAYTAKAVMSYSGKGPLAAGAAIHTTLDRSGEQDQTLEFSLGLKGASAAIESQSSIARLSGDWSTGVLAMWQGQSFYISGGGIYLGAPEAFQILARAGMVYRSLDVSAYVTQIIQDNQNPFSGVSLRVTL
jgi:hypothetical protein